MSCAPGAHCSHGSLFSIFRTVPHGSKRHNSFSRPSITGWCLVFSSIASQPVARKKKKTCPLSRHPGYSSKPPGDSSKPPGGSYKPPGGRTNLSIEFTNKNHLCLLPPGHCSKPPGGSSKPPGGSSNHPGYIPRGIACFLYC